MPQSWMAHCIFCEDVREEIGGQRSLVGIFSGNDIILRAIPPVTIPKLSFVIYVIADIGTLPDHAQVRILAPQGREICRTDFDLASGAPPAEATSSVTSMVLTLVGVLIEEAGPIDVVLTLGTEHRHIGALMVKFVS